MKKYVRASFNNDTMPSWLKEDKWALKALNQAGIDLANCEFSKTKQGKMGENYVAYLVKGTTYGDNYRPFVWIPGLYGDDTYVEDAPEYNYRAERRVPKSVAIRYMPKKYLNIEDTVYINIAGNKKAPREHYQDPRYDSKGEYAGQYFEPEKTEQWNRETKAYDLTIPAHWSEKGKQTWEGGRYGHNAQRDKSGYIIPDPKQRLKEFYKTEEGRSRRGALASREIEKFFGQLTSLKTEILNDLNNKSVETFGSGYKVLDYFNDAVRYYKNALDALKDRGWGVDPEGAISNINTAKDRLQTARDYLTGKRSW